MINSYESGSSGSENPMHEMLNLVCRENPLDGDTSQVPSVGAVLMATVYIPNPLAWLPLRDAEKDPTIITDIRAKNLTNELTKLKNMGPVIETKDYNKNKILN
jgi:hypothetical protein